MRFMVLTVALMGLFLAIPASAETPPTIWTVGVIHALDGAKLTVDSADGKPVTLLISANTVLAARRKATFADIKPNDFVASAGVLGADGKIHAQEVRIFLESMRGLGEGHRPMTQPNQTMTNATVAKIGPEANPPTSGSMTNATVTKIAGGVLTTTYPGGTTEIIVDPDTPVWRLEAIQPSQLTPGTSIRASARQGSDGALTAILITLQ